MSDKLTRYAIRHYFLTLVEAMRLTRHHETPHYYLDID